MIALWFLLPGLLLFSPVLLWRLFLLGSLLRRRHRGGLITFLIILLLILPFFVK